MKKGTLLTLLLAGVMGISTLTLAGCGGGDGGNNNGGDNSGGGSQQPGPVTPTPSNPVLQSAANSFTGAKATYAKSRYLDANGVETTFENLLDTQIDVLAQDLLYRLTYIYGSQNETNDNRTGNSIKTFEYSYGGAAAKSKVENMISNVSESFDSVTEINLNNVADTRKEFQKSLTIVDGDNYLNSITELKIVGAIEGYNSEIVEVRAPRFTFDKNESYAWEMSCESSTYENMLAAYKNEIKLGIAKILGASQTATEYSVNLLSGINKLGYFENHKQAIVNYVLNNVIGATQVAADNSYYNMWVNDYNGLINDETLTAVYSTATIDEKAPLLYKGYSIVVPAIVEQALANTFDGTTTSLYPKMTRTAVKTTNTATGFSEELPYETLTIKPKTGAKATKLVVSFQGVGTSIGKTITVKYTVQIGSNSASSQKQVTLASTATEVEFDLHSLMNSAAFSAYNGRDYAVTDGVAFQTEGEFTNGELTNTDGTSYIKLNISGLNGKSMKVTLNGLYDKV